MGRCAPPGTALPEIYTQLATRRIAFWLNRKGRVWMYAYAVAYAVALAGAEERELLGLEHPLPFVAGEEVWFEEPRWQEEGLYTTAHVLAAGATVGKEITVTMPVADAKCSSAPNKNLVQF